MNQDRTARLDGQAEATLPKPLVGLRPLLRLLARILAEVKRPAVPRCVKSLLNVASARSVDTPSRPAGPLSRPQCLLALLPILEALRLCLETSVALDVVRRVVEVAVAGVR